MSGAAYDTSLTDEYIAAVNRPAEVIHDFRHSSSSSEGDDKRQEASLVKDILGPDGDNTENPTAAAATASGSLFEEPVAFVIRNVLTHSECDDLIDAAENFGIKEGEKYVARTAKRTKNYTDTELSKKVEGRIRHILESAFRDPALSRSEMTGKENKDLNASTNKPADNKYSHTAGGKYMGPFCGIHNNWRILRYDPDGGDAFPAHQDQMDSFQKIKTDGSGRKDFVVSSHTLLIQLSQDTLEGGSTRFYPRGKIRLPKHSDNDIAFRKRQFEHAEDVVLPRGWALVFRQRGLMHAGQPLSVSSPCSKYVAQAGILRILPEGTLQRPAVFKNGAGVTNLSY